ncbi:MAG: hypothetical protein ACP5NV_00955 [Candidatus Woesearchaeota archaeon]
MNYDELLGKLEENDLEIFERDLKEGYVQKYIDRKKEFFKIKDKLCPVCTNNVKEDCFVFIWGEVSLRKKAHFCGKDCLEYFIKNNLKVKKDATKTT